MPVKVTTRLEDELAETIDQVAKQEGTDRPTVIRRLLQQAVKDWLIQENLDKYQEGGQTLWQAANRSGLTLWEMAEKARKHRTQVPYTINELKEDLKDLQ
jgi:predicted transcriptional regulator